MIILLISIFAMELIKYGLWFIGIRGERVKASYSGITAAVGYIFLVLTGVVNQNTLLIISSVAAVSICGMLLQGDKRERALLVLQAFFMVSCAGEITDGVIRLVQGTVWYEPDEMKANYLINNIIVSIIFVAAAVIKRKVKLTVGRKENKNYRWGIYIVIVIIGTVIFLTVTGFQSISQYLADEKVAGFSRIVSILSFASIACLVMLISYIFNENKRYKMYLEKDALLLETQRHMYESMLCKNEETGRFRHDIQNHLMCLNELARHGELDKVRNYIKGMEGNMISIQNKVYIIGNSVVDVVLNYYISMLEKGVKVSIEGQCAPHIKMSDVELCTVVSNLIQNAEEALNKSSAEERYLRIEFQSNKGYMRMRMKNSLTEGEVRMDKISKLPRTTKKNKSEHGIGILNVKETVEKNGGIFGIDVNKQEFTVTVMIPLDDRS